MTGFATLTSKNQLTLPVSIVDYMTLTPGTRFWVEKREREIVLEKVGDWEDFVGVFAENPVAKKYTVEQVIKKARRVEAKRLRHEVS